MHPAALREELCDLPGLMGPEGWVREYETVPVERTPGDPLGVSRPTPERTRRLPGEKLGSKRRVAEAAGGGSRSSTRGPVYGRGVGHTAGRTRPDTMWRDEPV